MYIYMYIYICIYIKYGRILSHAKSHFNMNRWHYIFATLVVGYQAESAQFFVSTTVVWKMRWTLEDSGSSQVYPNVPKSPTKPWWMGLN